MDGIFKIYDLPLIITGLDALPKFEFKNKNNEILKNFILYEMLKKIYWQKT